MWRAFSDIKLTALKMTSEHLKGSKSVKRITRETVFGEKSRLNAWWGAFGVDFQRQKSSDFNFRRLNHLPEWMCPRITIKSSSPPNSHVDNYIKYIVSNHYQINHRTVNHLLVVNVTKDLNLPVFFGGGVFKLDPPPWTCWTPFHKYKIKPAVILLLQFWE